LSKNVVLTIPNPTHMLSLKSEGNDNTDVEATNPVCKLKRDKL